jgi:phosphate transport system protein
MNTLLNSNSGQIESAEKTEKKLDKLDVKVDKLCQRIFALSQPVATDLRFIMSSLRIGNELERIGDIAVVIVNESEIINEQPQILLDFEIEKVFTEANYLIQQSFNNYTSYDAESINVILGKCYNLKQKCHKILDEIIVEMTHKNEVIVVATSIILILHQVERLADHASNIAENIYFMNEGLIIKHDKKR